MSNPTPEQIMKACQYLYYVGPCEIWTDFEYDKFCDRHGLNGVGGSDRVVDYSEDIAELAKEMHQNPTKFNPRTL